MTRLCGYLGTSIFRRGNDTHLERFLKGKQYNVFQQAACGPALVVDLPHEVVIDPTLEPLSILWRVAALQAAVYAHQALVDASGIPFPNMAKGIRAVSGRLEESSLMQLQHIARQACLARHQFVVQRPAPLQQEPQDQVEEFAVDSEELIVGIVPSSPTVMSQEPDMDMTKNDEATSKKLDEMNETSTTTEMRLSPIPKTTFVNSGSDVAASETGDEKMENTTQDGGMAPRCDRAPFPAAWGPPSQPVTTDPDYGRATSEQQQEWDDDMALCDHFVQYFSG